MQIVQWVLRICAVTLFGVPCLADAEDCNLARQKQGVANELEGTARLAAYQEIVRLCADFNVLYNLGRAYQETRKHLSALDAFDRALAAGSIETRYRGYTHARKAESLLALNRLAEALGSMEQAQQTVGGQAPEWFVTIRRKIDQHPRRNKLSANEIGMVLSLLTKSYGVVPRIGLKVHFGYDSAILTAVGREQVAELAQALERSADGYRIKLVGHTDVRGTAKYNQGLSVRRADAVKEVLLVEKPTLRGRVYTLGMGKSQPLYPGATKEDHRFNRRVEVALEK